MKLKIISYMICKLYNANYNLIYSEKIEQNAPYLFWAPNYNWNKYLDCQTL